ncbi:hypothetical protein DFJ77DRAFT_459696 [Powellomyces hirtus]|nr:hypothetical protein DFJ77DRAFT_459696 [Powellomyces hirtus]
MSLRLLLPVLLSHIPTALAIPQLHHDTDKAPPLHHDTDKAPPLQHDHDLPLPPRPPPTHIAHTTAPQPPPPPFIINKASFSDPSRDGLGSNSTRNSSIATEYLLIPAAIFLTLVILAIAFRMSSKCRSSFNRTQVTTSKPVQIVYTNVEHEDLIVRVNEGTTGSRMLNNSFGLREPTRLTREMRRQPTYESLATVYMDTPPSYSTDNLTAPTSPR